VEKPVFPLLAIPVPVRPLEHELHAAFPQTVPVIVSARAVPARYREAARTATQPKALLNLNLITTSLLVVPQVF